MNGTAARLRLMLQAGRAAHLLKSSAIRRKVRAEIGIECQVCKKARPRGDATIMLPGDRCKVCRSKDERPISIKNAAFEAAGLIKL